MISPKKTVSGTKPWKSVLPKLQQEIKVHYRFPQRILISLYSLQKHKVKAH